MDREGGVLCSCQEYVTSQEYIQVFNYLLIKNGIPENELRDIPYHPINWKYCPFCGRILNGSL
jgi:hypothetical protein